MNDLKKRILIVDDEEDLTWSLSRRLKRDTETFEIHCANSGYHALDVLSKNSIDLIVTDLRMPGLDGMELLTRVKDKYPNTTMIVMTAHGTVEVKKALDKIGIIGYLEKPFDFEELRDLINSSLACADQAS